LSEKAKFQVSLLLAFAFGLFLAAYPWEGSASLMSYPTLRTLLMHVLPKIGDAFMIAPLLAIAVELAAAQELLKTFAYDVSHHIIGRLLPPELREVMLGYLTTHFVRRHWFVEYRIGEWPSKPGFVKFMSLTEYELENRSDSPRPYPFIYEIEESYSPEIGLARICQVRASVDGLPWIEHKEEQVRGLLKHSGPTVTYCEELTIPRRPHGVYRFTAESVECLPDAFESAFIASVPVLETTVRVLYPKDKFRVHLIPSFGEESAVLKTELIDGDQWILNTPILPGQCFLVRWNLIKAAPLVSS
jgi:hypothetical protein